MALVTVGGVDLPTPSDYQVAIQMISKAARNAAGTMIIEKITDKRTLSLSWNYLSSDNLSTVLNAVSPAYFDVTYLDTQTNGYRTSSFYPGDRNVGMISFVDGVAIYKDIKFDLIER